MNLKKAKSLRKAAKNIVSQLTSAGQEIAAFGYVEIEKNRKTMEVDGKHLPISAGTILNAKNTVRGIYRNLKRSARNQRLLGM
ncbi:MAG: hypothetical protein QXN55_01280 [Candidatus Nitrosotenuis sp.]